MLENNEIVSSTICAAGGERTCIDATFHSIPSIQTDPWLVEADLFGDLEDKFFGASYFVGCDVALDHHVRDGGIGVTV